jgi:serine/threonine protein phosphatase PrpC
MADYLFGATDAGRVRQNNEDAFVTAEVTEGRFLIAGVIDGVGGYAGGEIAAALTKDMILHMLSVINTKDIIARLVETFNLANEKIVEEKRDEADLSNMACVATLAVIDRHDNQLFYIHVGDTRLYLFRDNSLIKISRDQSFVGFLEDSGRLTEEAAMQHPGRSQINQALGVTSRAGKTDEYFETGFSPFLPEDIILVCSDGLTDMVNSAVIADVLRNPGTLKAKAAKLIEHANEAGGNDNITVVLARNDNAPLLHEKAMPAAGAHTTVPVADPAVPAGYNPGAPLPVKAVASGRLTYILAVLCLIFLSTTLLLFFRSHTDHPVQPVAVPVLNPQEKLLQDMLAKVKGDTLLLSGTVFKTPVVLSKGLYINRDTLIIKTDGNVILRRGPAYRGPALILSPLCSYIAVDQLVITGFETGILSYKNALDLINTRFSNVKHPVQILFTFPAHSFVNGRISRRAYRTDSIARK